MENRRTFNPFARLRGSAGPSEGAETGEGAVGLTRHEEELRIGRRVTESGRARLRKSVESEPVETHVDLAREVARIERHPIGQPFPAAKFGEAEVEIPVFAERPVIEKETFATERISLETDVEFEQVTIEDEVRKERVAVEGALDGEGQEGDRSAEVAGRTSVPRTRATVGRRKGALAFDRRNARTAALAAAGIGVLAWRTRARRVRGATARERATPAKERAREVAATVKERGRETGRWAGERAKRATAGTRENPLGVAIGAAAVGFLAEMLVPASPVEEEKLGPAAEQVREQVKEAGAEALERGKEVAQDAS